MLSLSASTQVLLALGATDMRKGFEGLSGVVMSQLHGDPLLGALFLFINRRREPGSRLERS